MHIVTRSVKPARSEGAVAVFMTHELHVLHILVMEMDNQSLIRAVRHAMAEAGFTKVTDFAEAVGVHQTQMSRYLNGSTAITSQALERMSEALGISADQLRRRAAKILLETIDSEEVVARVDELAERVSAYEAESEVRRSIRRIEERLRQIEDKMGDPDDPEGE